MSRPLLLDETSESEVLRPVSTLSHVPWLSCVVVESEVPTPWCVTTETRNLTTLCHHRVRDPQVHVVVVPGSLPFYGDTKPGTSRSLWRHYWHEGPLRLMESSRSRPLSCQGHPSHDTDKSIFPSHCVESVLRLRDLTFRDVEESESFVPMDSMT